MLLLGIDIGTSSIKVSVVNAATQQSIASAHYPETESKIISSQPGWAEQSPDMWWEHVQLAILKMHAQRKYDSRDIAAIGIAYQMHGLVMVDAAQKVLRNSIIWCDSRAVEIGDKAFSTIGKEKCLLQMLNSPGNFTASKLAWVKQNEPALYAKADKIMLPGDFIAMKLTGNVTTTIAALSEGVFWDFQQNELSKDVFGHYELNMSLIPEIKNVFEAHGTITPGVASALSLKQGIPVTYKSGDQPNNALSLNVLEPGEVAATAGTSGVIYGVSDQLTYDNGSRVNSFAHVNYSTDKKRVGVLLCINGTGILNRWIRNMAGAGRGYDQLNKIAGKIDAGSEGLIIFPFGNGAERMLNNRTVGAHIHNIDLNKHSHAHLFRAAQEAIAFAFRYGLDIMRENGMNPQVIRAGRSNMFLSDVFTGSFVNTLNVPVEMYNCDGSVGAAIGAGLGAKIYSCPKEAFQHFEPVQLVRPSNPGLYNELYGNWLAQLQRQLN
ncbi:MAG TPA: FGGY family carbohydrate kinase [Chitinophagaceae bacterium]|nr:FGGY family carbohydrate kinase [Chitinophagaceae bacterium]